MTGRASAGRTRYSARASTRPIRSKIQRVASSATERDQLICLDLHEHRVLTTDQLFELHFSSIQRARARLSQLNEMGLIWRNRPRAHLGSLPWHYILNEIGSWVVAEYLGIEPHEVGYRNDRKRTLVDSPRLRHTRAANSFFTRLVYVGRTTKSPIRVADWRGEARCARRWQLHVRPDGFARLQSDGGSLDSSSSWIWGRRTEAGSRTRWSDTGSSLERRPLQTWCCSASRARLAKRAPVTPSVGRRCRSRQRPSTGT